MGDVVAKDGSARRIVVAAFCAYLCGLAFMVLVPRGDIPGRALAKLAVAADRMGAPDVLLGPTRVEFGANVLVVIPLVVMASWLLPQVRWTEWTAYCFIASLGVEAFQAIVLSGRSATFRDVVANTAGALIGAVIGWIVLRRRVRGFDA